MNLPSVKTLSTLTPDRAKELRKVLESDTRDAIEALLATGAYPHAWAWYRSCYHSMGIRTARLAIADEILGTYGVEYIGGRNRNHTPSIDYCNAGDTYTTTLLYVHFHGFKVGCIGDYIERGNYD